MKKISILGILAILVIVAEFTYAMIAGWVDICLLYTSDAADD